MAKNVKYYFLVGVGVRVILVGKRSHSLLFFRPLTYVNGDDKGGDDENNRTRTHRITRKKYRFSVY